jgi:putative transposase
VAQALVDSDQEPSFPFARKGAVCEVRLELPRFRRHLDASGRKPEKVSLAFGRAARQAGIAVSMGSRGDAYDNAVAETFFATLKKELVNRRSWPSRLELQSAVFEYIEAFDNRRRRHSTLGMVSPAEYERTPTMETSIKI